MANTAVPYGSDQQVKIQSVGLFAACMQRGQPASIDGRRDVKTGRRQRKYPTCQHQQKPIVRVQELTKSAATK